MLANSPKKYDLISLGEPLLRLSPPEQVQLRRASSLDLFVVGSQLNVAADLARLGKSTAFLTKLPENPLGQLALDSMASYGVDTSMIKMLPGGKMGTTYVEFSAAPRAPLAVYDRTGSAASTVNPDDFDWNSILSQTRFAYTDGIFPGLSESCKKAALEFVRAAKYSGCFVCFDVNYREHLWTPEAARSAWTPMLEKVDILVTNRDVSAKVFGAGESDEEMMRFFATKFGIKVVCMTNREMSGTNHGAWNSRALCEGQMLLGKQQEFDVVDRYGTGDAWLAGFIYGYMEKDIEYGLNFGNALCALAHTIRGDIAHVSPAEVRAIMDGPADLRVKR